MSWTATMTTINQGAIYQALEEHHATEEAFMESYRGHLRAAIAPIYESLEGDHRAAFMGELFKIHAAATFRDAGITLDGEGTP